ncbi:MAG TPA: arylamine N-acetyltransferase [Candidatus Baltobacteraceae bacterium]|nr:arylamine N-acetyltransferase [Candidatus Baltobacteraceae bacterium]
MTPKLAAYLRRIGYSGPLDPSVKTLRGLHRAHLLAISYENMDVQLGVPLSLDPAAVFEKIVERKRGGWCYEMNGLFAWALRELRFDISLLGAAVGRDQRGDAAAMNHLAILVHLDKPYLADVGFGNGFIAPIPLSEGMHSDGRFDFRLQQIDGDWWRFTNRPASGDTFDFQLTPYELSAFAEKNRWLQAADESYFVQNLVCHRFTDEGVVTLRGAVLTTLTPTETREQIAQSRDQLAAILREHFELRPESIDEIWERVAARHKQWLASRGYISKRAL